jgi:hypothetical protein
LLPKAPVSVSVVYTVNEEKQDDVWSEQEARASSVSFQKIAVPDRSGSYVIVAV